MLKLSLLRLEIRLLIVQSGVISEFCCHVTILKTEAALKKKKASKFWFTTILYHLLEEETEYLFRAHICLVEVSVGADNKLALNTAHPKGSPGFCFPSGSGGCGVGEKEGSGYKRA